MSDNNTKSKIIEAMYHLVAEKGYDKASINHICNDVGITKPSVYYYFRSKEEIFLAVLDRLYPLTDYIKEAGFDAIDDIKSYREKLIGLGFSLIESYRDDTERRLVLAEVSIQSERITSVWDHKARFDQAKIETWEAILKQGVEIGAFDKQFNTELCAQTLYVILAGISYSIAYKDKVDAKSIWKDAIDHLFFSNAN